MVTETMPAIRASSAPPKLRCYCRVTIACYKTLAWSEREGGVVPICACRTTDMASSKMLEGYCADIEHLLREGSLRQAVRLAVALPDICATLESEGMESSRAGYVRWCAR